MNFRKGQEVICINAKGAEDDLIVNQKYITETASYTSGLSNLVWVQLVGVSDAYKPGMAGWRADRFRPLISKSTNISIFTAMLGPKAKEFIS